MAKFYNVAGKKLRLLPEQKNITDDINKQSILDAPL